ncbi:reticulon-4-interacting protein 1 homolog, mitochondrial-like isoform X2 [Xenia sp. Carnegie-2017]|nr:reticulon-4-interacting protein 1 homolog, mitochondrial-like isoform X2 [Xenia sp. Carnegie-2017]
MPKLEQIKLPTSLGTNEILVQVKAASLNPIDVKMTQGFGSVLFKGLRKLNRSTLPEFPVILGRDFSGIVVKTGSHVTRLKEGDEVWGTPAVWKQGSFAEYCLVGQDEIALKPKSLSYVEAVSFPYVYLTMWAALCNVCGLKQENAKGKRIFIVGGSGGVGNIGIQMMKEWGAHVTTSCSTDAIDLVKKLGADDVIDYKTEDLVKRLKNEPRYDVILDSVGTNLEYFKSGSKRSCNKTSKYVTLMPPLLDIVDESGLALGTLAVVNTFLRKAVTLRFQSNLDYHWGFFRPNSNALNYLNELVTKGKVVPVIDSVFPFHSLPEAFEKMNLGHLRGKIVVDYESLR